MLVVRSIWWAFGAREFLDIGFYYVRSAFRLRKNGVPYVRFFRKCNSQSRFDFLPSDQSEMVGNCLMGDESPDAEAQSAFFARRNPT